MTGRELSERVIAMSDRARERWLASYRPGDPERAPWFALERALRFRAEILEWFRLKGVFSPGQENPWPDEVPNDLALPLASEPPDDGGPAS